VRLRSRRSRRCIGRLQRREQELRFMPLAIGTPFLSRPEPMDQPIRILLADDHQVVGSGLRQAIEKDAELSVVAEAGTGIFEISGPFLIGTPVGVGC